MGLKEIASGILYGGAILTAVRIFLGALMIFSGWFKAIDTAAFGLIIIKYDIIPAAWTPYPAAVLPFLEILIGAALMAGYKIRSASLISALMMAVFSVFIAINVIRGNIFDCGCFELTRLGIGVSEEVSITLVIRDIILAGLFIAVGSADRYPLSVDGAIENFHLNNP